MFTGMIEEKGKIISILKHGSSAYITIQCKKVLEGTKTGDSIAVNGICLTVTAMGKDFFGADIMAETMRRSSLNQEKVPAAVNLERAMAADGRFGGHIVSGHIDGIGQVIRIWKEENAVWYEIGAEPKLLNYVIEKGSIAIEGISLTVAEVSDESFQVSVIPHTRQETILEDRRAGSPVNLECDLVGKYIERFSGYHHGNEKKSKLTEQFLTMHGFV